MKEKKHWELRKLLEAIELERNWKPAKPVALQKVMAYLQGMEKPKRSTLDKLSLFVGFQDWESFQRALHGEAAASENYEVTKEQGDNEASSETSK
jgi:hypothetical protein